MKEQCRRGFPTGKLKREHSTVEREYRPLDIIITTVTQPLKIMPKKRVNVTVQNKTAAKTGKQCMTPPVVVVVFVEYGDVSCDITFSY